MKRSATAAEAMFKPALTRTESRQDATTRAAMAIIASESAATEAKTDRLRAARLAREAQTAATAEPAGAKAKTTKRRRKA